LYEVLNFKIQGTTPTILHNGQMADPLNRYAKALKEITPKQKKTDPDHEAMARIEWEAGLYLDSDLRVSWPGENIQQMLVAAARKTKAGKDAMAGLFVAGMSPIQYDGPTGVEELWEDERFRLRVPVRVKQARVMRTRPIFRDWGIEFAVNYLPEVIKPAEIKSWVQTAGVVIGLSDWRPQYGKFVVVT
jgi:hypothetical protein